MGGVYGNAGRVWPAMSRPSWTRTAAWNAPALFKASIAELDEDLSGEGLLLGVY